MSPKSTPSPTLLVKVPKGGMKELEVFRTPFTIGRRADNDLCLEDVAVSGHHARIAQIQEVLFLEDLHSTNGTFVNEQKIDRRQLQDADSIRIGAHRLIFRGTQVIRADSSPSNPLPITDKTIVVPHSHAGDLPMPQTAGLIEILSGKTSQSQYRLTKHVSLIGAQDGAVITLTGWFAPKTAAVISRRGEAYVVSPTESGKRIQINGRPIQGEQVLLNGDVVEVAGITMRFLERAPKKGPATT
jgi:pSer/pThr/pTyr-binding forkhead associated (FHA) protein